MGEVAPDGPATPGAGSRAVGIAGIQRRKEEVHTWLYLIRRAARDTALYSRDLPIIFELST
jgi:hypothetical protein